MEVLVNCHANDPTATMLEMVFLCCLVVSVISYNSCINILKITSVNIIL